MVAVTDPSLVASQPRLAEALWVIHMLAGRRSGGPFFCACPPVQHPLPLPRCGQSHEGDKRADRGLGSEPGRVQPSSRRRWA